MKGCNECKSFLIDVWDSGQLMCSKKHKLLSEEEAQKGCCKFTLKSEIDEAENKDFWEEL